MNDIVIDIGEVAGALEDLGWAPAPGAVDALKVRRALGRDDWSPPRELGPDGWIFRRVRGRARTAIVWGRADGRPALPEFGAAGSI